MRVSTPSADEDYGQALWMQGSASTLPVNTEESVIDQLHAVVKEVTGRDVEQPQKPRIGFLP